MNAHPSQEMVERWADGEIADAAFETHIRECATCSNAALAAVQMKRAVREAFPREAAAESLRTRITAAVRADAIAGDSAPAGLRRIEPSAHAAPHVPALSRLRRRPALWLSAAAIVAAVVIALPLVVRQRGAKMRELADLHNTILASASPVDVISTDRHTVKPWFEGRVPFAVPVGELTGTPFHLVGGRVVYLDGAPGACLLVGKGAHRISLFIFRAGDVDVHAGAPPELTTVAWRANGLVLVAIGDVPQSDLEALRRAWTAPQ